MGRPIPTLFSIDEAQRVIYLNTFSKTIAPLHPHQLHDPAAPPAWGPLPGKAGLLRLHRVVVRAVHSGPSFMEQGRYEQHLSRMKNRYRQRRDAVIRLIRRSPLGPGADHGAGRRSALPSWAGDGPGRMQEEIDYRVRRCAPSSSRTCRRPSLPAISVKTLNTKLRQAGQKPQ